jgi:SIR2-like domain
VKAQTEESDMAMQGNISDWMMEKISRGQAILFLGAGSSKGAVGPKGEKALRGEELRDRISERFLGGKKKDRPLSEVADYAKNESSLFEVQHFVGELFEPLQPAPFHALIATFRWHAIVTTNYDLVVERAYQKCGAPIQRAVPILSDGDKFQQKISDPGATPLLKLHGCVTRLNDPNLPLILASEEYAKHKKGRELLFRHFTDWAKGYPIIFCGYEIADPNLQQIFFDVGDASVNRPAYVNVNPGLDEIAIRYWGARRFMPIRATFEEFLMFLDGNIPNHVRQLSLAVNNSALSYGPLIRSGASPSDRFIEYTKTELSHIYKGMSTKGVSPKEFYHGQRVDWAVFDQQLDVRRRITDDILLDNVVEEPSTAVRVVLLKGHAGAGKSVSLKRVLWESVQNHDALGFYLEEGALLRLDLIEELSHLVDRRILIVVDEVLSFEHDIPGLVSRARKRGLKLTLLLGARTNEWNVHGAELQPFVDKEYELRDLSEREIEGLLDRLKRYSCLGHLEAVIPEKRVEHFRLYAERQLLVALHEATAGKPFEEIVYDEYLHVTPGEARSLYLDVCSLHRLRVPMRAGLLSRISGITFEKFSNEFFEPLEHVVRAHFDTASRDYVYRSRHSLIAEMVFEHALKEPGDRAAQIIRIVRCMNIDYESDRQAFDHLIRGRALAELFGDLHLAYQIFDAALESGASKWYVLHQRAVFELNHFRGSTKRALEAIKEAELAATHPDRTVRHTRALILRRLALETENPAERDRYRSEAKGLLTRQLDSAKESHSHHAYAQILLDELDERIQKVSDENEETAPLTERAIAELVREIEQVIFVGLQRFPGDEHLLVLESKFAQLIENDPRSARALERAFASSPGRAFVAVRLARYQLKKGDAAAAKKTMEQCLHQNPSSKEAHYEYALLLIKENEARLAKEIGHHLRRSFTKGDTNYDARFSFASVIYRPNGASDCRLNGASLKW